MHTVDPKGVKGVKLEGHRTPRQIFKYVHGLPKCGQKNEKAPTPHPPTQGFEIFDLLLLFWCFTAYTSLLIAISAFMATSSTSVISRISAMSAILKVRTTYSGNLYFGAQSH